MKKTAVISLAVVSVLGCLIISFAGGGLTKFVLSIDSIIHTLEWVGLGIIALFVGAFVILGTIVIFAAVWDELFRR
ncbi:hypothetical protein ACGP04_01360 [Piscirickettsia salmonis]|uniref:hypothetical protein n=1 Tax=Piscirickettsia salmonis TaxID=1238 RepID=UPI000F08FF49|nr:hypothetical protein DA717_06160 [Piscirickettsiaceae bacterium NZ-RLO2]